MSRYTHKNYGGGFACKVTPVDRGADVLNYLITGHPLCGRSLDGVKVEFVDQPAEWTRALNQQNAQSAKQGSLERN